MLQRLSIALAKAKAENTSENLLNKFHQTIYLLLQAKKVTEKVYNDIMNGKKLKKEMNIIFLNFEISKTSDYHRVDPHSNDPHYSII